MKTFGPVDERSQKQLQTCEETASSSAFYDGTSIKPGRVAFRSVLCGDHHPGYSMPIGGVLAIQNRVIPAGVGYDIACGNCAVKLDIDAKDVDVARVMDQIWKDISFGMGRANNERVDHAVLEAIPQAHCVPQRALAKLAADQLGTVGSGNHYVDLFEDRADGKVWIGVHFGSRGFGHKTCTGFLALAAGKAFDEHVSEGGMDDPPVVFDLNSQLGQDYMEAMAMAGQYAYAGREWVVAKVARILGVTEATMLVHNHHNYAWIETHNGVTYVVIRKGATPAFPGQLGFVGATMGEDAVILRGVDSPASQEALYSTVHGAGRVMSRKHAAGKVKMTMRWKCQDHRRCNYSAPKGGFHKAENGPTPKCPNCGHKLRLTPMEETIREGAVNWPEWQAKLKAQGIEVRGGGADEAPQCYKRLDEVLTYHAGTVEIMHRLKPLGVAMAGRETVDPYKD